MRSSKFRQPWNARKKRGLSVWREVIGDSEASSARCPEYGLCESNYAGLKAMCRNDYGGRVVDVLVVKEA